jgi:glutamate/tyrosine decarboxylase-like PLP-dependent enzyme
MKTLRDKMLLELEEKNIFEHARQYAFDYLDNALERNVFPSDEAIHNLGKFVEDMPDYSGDSLSILRQLHEYGSPATVSQIGGRYFGLVNGGVIPASLATRWLSDCWDQNTPLYLTSPVTSKLEEITETWIKDLLGLPEQVVAGFVSGSSMAIFCGLAAARYRIFQNNNWDVNAKGLNGAPGIRVVTGRHAHGTVVKAIALLGLGIDNIEWVDVDNQGRIIPSSIPELDQSSILILQAGNVNSGSFDAFDEICEKARKANAWVHIDGAFGLWAAGSEDLNHLTKGIEKANSWSVDGHKTLNVPYDSGILLCDDKDALIHALQASGSYIVYSQHRDGMLYTPEMSRRARVIELWVALKYLGKSGVNELVIGLHKRAVQFSAELKQSGFNILNDVVFNQVLVACETDELTNKVIQYVQSSGECWVGGGKWDGKDVIRISVCSWATTQEDITRSVNAFVAAKNRAIIECV